MTTVAEAGPFYSWGQIPTPGGLGSVTPDYNPHRGPSLFDQGLGIMDPRLPFAYQPGGTDTKTYGWLGVNRIPVLNAVPYTLTAGAIAPAAVVVSGTPMVLLAATATGVTVGASVVNSLTGVNVTGLLAIGGAMGAVSFGSSGGTNIWDPTKALARAVSITAQASAAGGAFKIAGYDIYGYPMSETITSVANSTVNGKKAWKYIASVTPQFSDPTYTYSCDTTDIIGLALRADYFGETDIFYGTAGAPVITAGTGFTAAVTTTATATTGDTRGTYALQTPSNNTLRLLMFVSPSVANIGGYTGTYPSGLVGVSQF